MLCDIVYPFFQLSIDQNACDCGMGTPGKVQSSRMRELFLVKKKLRTIVHTNMHVSTDVVKIARTIVVVHTKARTLTASLILLSRVTLNV